MLLPRNKFDLNFDLRILWHNSTFGGEVMTSIWSFEKLIWNWDKVSLQRGYLQCFYKLRKNPKLKLILSERGTSNLNSENVHISNSVSPKLYRWSIIYFLKGQVGNYARYQTSNQRSNIHCTRSKRFILIRWRKTCLVFTVISHKWLTAVTNKSQLSREIRQHRSKDLPCFPSAGNCSQPSHKTNMSSEE